MPSPLRARALGWAGVELEHDGYRLVIDAFADPGPFAAYLHGPDPRLLAPDGPVDAALVTHLHADHTDVATLAAVLRPGAPLLGPHPDDGPGDEGVRDPQRALAEAGLVLTPAAPGDEHVLGPFTVTAVDALDGLGDPQVSWVVATGSARVFHGGDTMWHGSWWRLGARYGPFDAAFLPANGARISFPWMQPAADVPASLTPEQAVAAARALRADELVAVHHSVIEHERFYRPVPDVPGAVATAAARYDYPAHAAVAGEEMAW